MVDRNLLREFDVSEDELTALVVGEDGANSLDQFLGEGQSFEIGRIVSGKVIEIVGDQVVVDVGYKSEGLVPLNEWEDEPPPEPGDERRGPARGHGGRDRRDRPLAQEGAPDARLGDGHLQATTRATSSRGKVTRKIKGGLLVDIGVNVFLPASQVDIRRPSDIADYIDQEIECMILKIDESRRNIVVSRRKLIEITREQQKKQLLEEIAVGQVRTGTVKNIADFGAFVDLGGIDGLLHITDMSWGRINHPSDMVKIDDQIEVMVLHVDKDREKIALGLKQKSASPWENVAEEVPGRHPRHGRGRQRHELRRLRQARGGDRGPGPHLRDVLDQADQPPQRAGQHRRQDRGRRPGHQPGEAGNLAGHEADPGQPLGPGRRQVPARARWSRAPSAT